MKTRLILFAILLNLTACNSTPNLTATAPPPTRLTLPPTAAALPRPTNTLPLPPIDTSTPVATTDLLISDLTPKQGAGTPPQNAGNGGPWSTRLMLATSSDGLTFNRANVIISDQAGVPNAMLDRDGRARLYYIDYGNGNIIATAIQKSADEWALHKVIINGLGPGNLPVDPSVVLLPDGRYRLYYMQSQNGQPPTIYSAISNDGVTFTTEAGARYNPSDVYDPSVLQTPTRWLLWTGPDGQHSAKSTEGLLFEDTGPFKVDGKTFMVWSTVAIPNTGYRVYGSLIGPGSGPHIYSAFSTDGVTWHLDPGTRLNGAGDPALEKRFAPDNGVARLSDGTYLMAYLAEIP